MFRNVSTRKIVDVNHVKGCMLVSGQWENMQNHDTGLATEYGYQQGIGYAQSHYDPIIKALKDALGKIATMKIPYCDANDVAHLMRETAQNALKDTP